MSADSVGASIVAANKAPDPKAVATRIVRDLFDQGSNRLSSAARYAAVTMLTAALTEWKDQLMSGTDAEVKKWKDIARDAKMHSDELELFLAMKKAEGKIQE